MGRKKTCTSISERRRQQNRLSQQRWREKRKRAVVENPYKQSECHSSPAGKFENIDSSTSSTSNTETFQSRQKSAEDPSSYSIQTPISSLYKNSAASQSHDLGDVSAKDIIDALALPEGDPGSDFNGQSTSLQDMDPQHLSKSQLLSLAYCSPSICLSFSLQSMHFAKALIRNTIAFGFDLRYMSKTESVSFISQDWSKYLATQKSFGAQQSNGFGNKSSDQSGEKATMSSQKIVREANISSDLQLLRWKELPKNMLPTEDQLTIRHHPYIDVSFPWPKMRSKLLKLLNTVIDYNEFCDAVFKAGLLPRAEIDEPAFYIWGDETMDESAWEVGERFAKKWWFLLDDAIIRRTNWWRRLRGLEELSIDLKSSL